MVWVGGCGFVPRCWLIWLAPVWLPPWTAGNPAGTLCTGRLPGRAGRGGGVGRQGKEALLPNTAQVAVSSAPTPTPESAAARYRCPSRDTSNTRDDTFLLPAGRTRRIRSRRRDQIVPD